MTHTTQDATKNIGQHDAPVPEKGSATVDQLVEQYATLFATGLRTPVLERPSDYGMDFDNVTFPSLDGVPLEGWFIPAESNKLLVVNHPMTCNRYGFPGHLEPYNQMFGGFEVNFLPELKHLHDAGYNILTYDLRNCGLSGEGNGGYSGLGLLEARDVVGSVRYVKNTPQLAGMSLGLYSRCMGGNSTIMAMDFWPEEFDSVQALALLNVVSGAVFIEDGANNIGANPAEAIDKDGAQASQHQWNAFVGGNPNSACPGGEGPDTDGATSPRFTH